MENTLDQTTIASLVGVSDDEKAEILRQLLAPKNLDWLVSDPARAEGWKNRQNQQALMSLVNHPEFHKLFAEALAILEDNRALPSELMLIGDFIFGFLKNGTYPKGVWVRSPVEAFRADPETVQWEVIISMAELEAEHPELSLRWHGVMNVSPCRRYAVLKFSHGGGDDVEIREFNLETLAFIEDGFVMPVADNQAMYLDSNTLAFNSNLFEGENTVAGFSSAAYIWHRGESYTDAHSREPLLTVPSDHGQLMVVDFSDGQNGHVGLLDMKNQEDHQVTMLRGPQQEHLRIGIPRGVAVFHEYSYQDIILTRLRDHWGEWRADSIVGWNMQTGKAELIYTPPTGGSIQNLYTTPSAIYVIVLENAACRLRRLTRSKDGTWSINSTALADGGVIRFVARHGASDTILVTQDTMKQPATLYWLTGGEHLTDLWQATEHVDASDFIEQQVWFESGDVMVPMTLVGSKEAWENPNGAPTLLTAYCGFAISRLPTHDALRLLWCKRGGLFGIVHGQGGGEFGEAWHKAGWRENRHVQCTTVADGVQYVQQNHKGQKRLASRVAITGGSNGGWLVARAMQVCAERGIPLHAVVCTVPLYLMQGFPSIGIGKSWCGEIGNPDTDWEWMAPVCPYTQAQPASQVTYPPVLTWTSTTDLRTGFIHGRIMAAQMQALGHTSFYYESPTGGHGGNKNTAEAAFKATLEMSFMVKCLMSTSN